MKAFKNIVIIAMIGMLSSTYLFNLAPIDYKGTIEIETPKESSTLNLKVDNEGKNLINPNTIVISHVSENNEVVKSILENIFTATVYKNNNIIKSNLNLETVATTPNTSFTVNKDNPIQTTLDISQKKLGLEDGNYEIVFESSLIGDSNKSSISVSVSYDTKGKYYPALNEAPTKTKGLTLYFANENADTLIPVTRFQVEDKSLTRMTIQQLQNGPINKDLHTVIKDVTNITYNNGNVKIDIPSSYTAYDNGSTGGLLSYNAFVKSIFAVDKYWPIKSISFTVDRKKADVYFHGIDISSPILNNNENYLVYLAYNSNGRYYLFEHKVDLVSSGIREEETIEIKAQKLFDAYKDIKINYGLKPIPEDINLQNVSLENRILVLDFNDNLLKEYSNKDDLKLMMIESLIYSFTTIPNVDGIKITVNNSPINNFIKDRDLTGILYPPKFINPELVE
ncbi:MAG: hypothetical protein K0Q97_58 [Bacillota bacterium]|jgi:hypothetical protein|nr:hypothetical protein [Bacillota bacterium]